MFEEEDDEVPPHPRGTKTLQNSRISRNTPRSRTSARRTTKWNNKEVNKELRNEEEQHIDISREEHINRGIKGRPREGVGRRKISIGPRGAEGDEPAIDVDADDIIHRVDRNILSLSSIKGGTSLHPAIDHDFGHQKLDKN